MFERTSTCATASTLSVINYTVDCLRLHCYISHAQSISGHLSLPGSATAYNSRWPSGSRLRVPCPLCRTSRIHTSGSRVWVRASRTTPPSPRGTNRPCAPVSETTIEKAQFPTGAQQEWFSALDLSITWADTDVLVSFPVAYIVMTHWVLHYTEKNIYWVFMRENSKTVISRRFNEDRKPNTKLKRSLEIELSKLYWEKQYKSLVLNRTGHLNLAQ